MALARRNRTATNTWPGFVDALASLLMVIVFLVMIFVLAQFFLGEGLSQRDNAIKDLGGRLSALTESLSMERKKASDLSANVTRLSDELQASLAKTAALNEENDANISTIEALAGDVGRLSALKKSLEAEVSALAGKLDKTEGSLLSEQELSRSARAEIALLTQQTTALKDQMAALSAQLDVAERVAEEQNVQIVTLGKRLNAALATKVQELSRYRSEFFGRLREILGGQAGVRIVGDRFVFQSEVLFASGEAILAPEGQAQLGQLAHSLKDLAKTIPVEIDWVMRVDGHTDRVPISTLKFASNWELSSARAISVVKYLIGQGVAPHRLVAAGFGEYQPIDDRDDEIAYRRNRRIELKLTQR